MRLTALLLCLFLLIPTFSAAGEDVKASLLVGLWTAHVNPSSDTNESNELIGVGYRDYTVARFKNSYHDETFFAGKRFSTRRFGETKYAGWFCQLNLYAGILYGYDDHIPNIKKFTIGPLPTIGLGYKNTAFETLFFPSPSGGVFMGVLSLRFYGMKPPQ